ncbi:MAG TPA: universal stress protein [Thermoanaerobaculia bacterium]|nr:universal stress protein [Thermoanaerobaculia bacterium]
METPRLILVPTDLSDAAAHALRYASGLAERFGAHLLVIHADVFMPPVDVTAAAAGVFEFARQRMIDEATEALQTHAERNISSSVPFDVRVIVSEPLAAIVGQIRESGAEIVVMGTHGRTGVRRLVVGSMTEAVMRRAPVPVIAVNPDAGESASVRTVACPVMLTDAGREALRQAAIIAGPQARFSLLRCVEQPDAHMGAHDLTRVQMWIPAELRARCDVVLIPSDEHVDEILQFALAIDAGLIALGIPSERTLADSFLGTLAERIVQHSRCPVLTVNALATQATQRECEPAMVR